jgi:predicted metalloprotease with PDZ domain
MGMLLDLAIRQASSNKKSLDDVMRYLYTKYYQEKKRGFTEGEFQQACETAAGKSLAELFDYVYTTKEIDYNKYLAYAGLTADITPKTQPGGWLGTSTFQKGDSLVVSGVDWQSPAWEAHLRRKVVLLKVNGSTANKQQLDAFLAAATPGTGLKLQVFMNGATKDIDLTLGKKTRIPFDIRPLPNPDPLQRAILKSWLGE